MKVFAKTLKTKDMIYLYWKKIFSKRVVQYRLHWEGIIQALVTKNVI